MPLYEFKNSETDQVEEISLKISEYDQFRLDNPKYSRFMSSKSIPGIADAMAIGVTKPPRDFQEGVLGRIKASVPGNNIKSKRWEIPG